MEHSDSILNSLAMFTSNSKPNSTYQNSYQNHGSGRGRGRNNSNRGRNGGSGCGHGGLVEEGRQFFNSMTKQYKIEPKLEHYGCLIDLLGRAGKLDEAENLIEEVPKENNEIVVPLRFFA
ncbi:pentatricopeptide repeat-containing protein [Quercus suber]|uniref:Pentatricopeptide repeat-containing protein n=2 Tax=Quercus suber TaxID=58331 RepID=A0AAW0KX12_QUESU